MASKTEPQIYNIKLNYVPANTANKGYDSNVGDFPDGVFIRNSDMDDYWRELKTAQREIFAENGVDKSENMIFTISREALERVRDESEDENIKGLSNALLKDNRFECVAGLDRQYNSLGITLLDLKALGTRQNSTNPDPEADAYTIRKDDFDWIDQNKNYFLKTTESQLKNVFSYPLDTYITSQGSNKPQELENSTYLPSQNDTLMVSYDVYDGETDTTYEKGIGELLSPELSDLYHQKEETDWWPFW